jgi:hypothetical protein
MRAWLVPPPKKPERDEEYLKWEKEEKVNKLTE